MQSLINEYCKEFISKKDRRYVGKNFIPIIWFGDLNKYFSKDLKVVTTSINPSAGEFITNRFPHQDKIRTDLNNNKIPTDLESDLNNYFNYNPYSWFNDYERKLNELGTSYKDGAIHIDLFTAIPTNPIWRGLTGEERSELYRLDLTMKLINKLNPDLILISCEEGMFNTIFTGIELVKDFTVASNRKLKLYNWNGTKILFGTNCQGHPFRSVYFTDELKDLILNY